jgi:hypothetical protein
MSYRSHMVRSTNHSKDLSTRKGRHITTSSFIASRFHIWPYHLSSQVAYGSTWLLGFIRGNYTPIVAKALVERCKPSDILCECVEVEGGHREQRETVGKDVSVNDDRTFKFRSKSL